ncbi:MAG TPA: glycosyltransferase family 39 protein [Aggregatilineaceae bacterium]|nr:glycosyltransferase family 39 protein [Aggregatilineaceae bacterium]
MLAAGLRYTGYNYSLPYIDHADEPAYNLAGRMIIDFGSAKPLGMQGYPPGIITLNYVLLRFFQNPAKPPGSILYLVRLIAITFSVVAVAGIGLLAYRMADPLSGLLAAGLWAVAPIVVEHSRYATADPFVTCFTVLAIFLALSGTLYDRDRWCTAATVTAMFAIIFKYQAVTVLPAVLFAPLWRLRTQRNDKRRILTNFGNNVLALGIFSFWLLAIYPATEASASPAWSAAPARYGIPSLHLLRENLFQTTLAPITSTGLWVAGFTGLAFWLLLGADGFNLLGIAVIAASAVLWLISVSLFGDQPFRQFVSVGALATVLCGVGLAGWVRGIGWALDEMAAPVTVRHRATSGALAVAGAVLVLSWPQIDGAIRNAREHTLPDRRNDLATYMDTSLAPGPYISDVDNHKTLDGPWGGYTGQHEFPYAARAVVTARPVEEWRKQGVLYAIVPYPVYQGMQSSPKWRTYLDKMLLLKSYPPSNRYRGPAMIVFRLYPMQHELSGILGPIRLIGYDIDHTEVSPGSTITFSLYWQASGTTDADYTVYNHLVPLNARNIVAQIDGPPLADERRPTQTWNDPGETLVSRPFTLTVSADVSPGQYRLITGFYRRDTWERLTAPNGDDFQLVTTVAVNK